uniref:Uncharacterized protein n=1 Tax=Ditylenchus dipsaci TaxID=166011 RepID=A0A915DUS3_9BILA
MENVVTLLKPIRMFSEKLQSSALPTISLLYCGIQSLIEHMSSSPHPIARKLKEALQKRFKDVLQSGEEASDPIFISSAVLDISVANLLSDEQLQKARPALQSMLVEVPSSIIIEECIDQESSPFGFAVKKRKVVLSTGSIEQEIESYIEALKGLPSNYDCIKYWHNEER